jgi:membrane-bound ClpP family serine protease
MENTSEVEQILLDTVNELKEISENLYKTEGTNSYEKRCNLYDAYMKIYSLTNEYKEEEAAKQRLSDAIAKSREDAFKAKKNQKNQNSI